MEEHNPFVRFSDGCSTDVLPGQGFGQMAMSTLTGSKADNLWDALSDSVSPCRGCGDYCALLYNKSLVKAVPRDIAQGNV